jgi:hypothetical protein
MMALAAPDEIMVAAQIFDHSARRRSYAILADQFGIKPADHARTAAE